ncbi:aldehyde ferredoxin oxidoreductase C-terminal domain-containing protein, partial [Chloroflexota bacterium]
GLVEMIAHRQGPDDWLLQGASRAGVPVGGAASVQAIQVAGVETGAQGDPDQVGDVLAELGPDQVKDREDRASVLDSVGICRSSGIFLMDGVEWSDIAEAMEAATGMEMPVERLRLLGERIYNLQRGYNASHGIIESDDWLQYLFGAELPRTRGAREEDAGLEPSLAEYYRLRGWDPESGWATEEKLLELGLGEIAGLRLPEP